ncbi:MAG: hypothetical protein RQ745_09920 [Longimicrobiales bacterium]|nr:hypothetical protein [Longimicrobiales bacterium]
MLDQFGSTFLALGPPLILLAGTGITVVVAAIVTGPIRWWVLGIGPALSLAAAWGSVVLVVELIDPAEGSGFLLGGAAIGLYVAAALIYYPVLAAAGIWRWSRRQPVRPANAAPSSARSSESSDIRS